MKRKTDDYEFIKEEKKVKFEKIKGILFLIWFATSIILLIYFSETGRTNLTLCLFGHYFAIFGFMAYTSEPSKKRIEEIWMPLLFMFVGTAIMAVSLLCHFGIIQIQ